MISLLSLHVVSSHAFAAGSAFGYPAVFFADRVMHGWLLLSGVASLFFFAVFA